MDHHPFGRADQSVSVVGQGTWNVEKSDRPAAVKALRRGVDLGMTHIDTAEMYGNGAAEELVGQAIAGRRDEVFLVSKVLPSNASKAGTLAACEASLKRLKTDHLDCYLLHWRGSHPLKGTFEAFERLRDSGKILSWGVSNFDVSDLEDALAAGGDGRIACNQVLYHLKQRAVEHSVLPWCEAHNVAVVGYSPFGQNDFPAPKTRGGQVLRQIADAHHATPRQVALRFLTRRPSLFAIPKASSPDHVAENAGAGSLVLTEEESRRLNDAFPLGPPPRQLPML